MTNGDAAANDRLDHSARGLAQAKRYADAASRPRWRLDHHTTSDVARGEFVSLHGAERFGDRLCDGITIHCRVLDVPDLPELWLLDGVVLRHVFADHQLADLRLVKLGFVFQAFKPHPGV
jgi:hypothetical protein